MLLFHAKIFPQGQLSYILIPLDFKISSDESFACIVSSLLWDIINNSLVLLANIFWFCNPYLSVNQINIPNKQILYFIVNYNLEAFA